MAAMLVASALGLTGMAALAAPDAEGSYDQQQAATESKDERRKARSERDRSKDTERRSARQQRQAADNGANREGKNRADGSGQRRDARDRGAASDDNRRDERRRMAEGWADRARAGDRRDGAIRDRRFTDNRRDSANDRRDLRKTNDRSHDRAQRGERRGRAIGSYADQNRAKHGRFDDRVDRRMSNQRARIRDGWKNGELSRRESRQLRKDQKKISRMDRRFGSDGRYTRYERRKLNNALDHSSRRVQRAKQRGFDNRVDRRVSNQRARIRDGWKSGELSRGEFKRLRRDQKQIARMDRHFGSDGRYTKRERKKLSNALDRSSRRVYRAKHNDRVAHRVSSNKRRR